MHECAGPRYNKTLFIKKWALAKFDLWLVCHPWKELPEMRLMENLSGRELGAKLVTDQGQHEWPFPGEARWRHPTVQW